MPLPPIYDVIIALLVIVPMGLFFFSSVFLYNMLCSKNLLSSDEAFECAPVKKMRYYLAAFAMCFGISAIFYLMIVHDNFDYSLLFFVPPFAVAILCELKNGFTPAVSALICGICVVIRFICIWVFQGLSFGLSVLLSFVFSFLVVLVPRLVFGKGDKKPVELLFVTVLSLLASYLSPLYAVIFIGAVYGIVALGYELPNYVAKKRCSKPIFTFKPPMLFISSFIFAIILFI